MAEIFPRDLTNQERDLLWWVLPEGRPGYARLRDLVASMRVVGAGRRGEGNYILGPAGMNPDVDSPLPSVFAFGVVETARGICSVTVREEFAGQVEFEIVDPPQAGEVRRWSYSSWVPGSSCPQCDRGVREVAMTTETGHRVTLAICAGDRRLWVHEGRTGVCRPVPVTLYYSELMRRTGVRDPKLALQSSRLFDRLPEFDDDALAVAFIAYNRVRSKVRVDDPIRLPRVRPSFLRRLFSFSRS